MGPDSFMRMQAQFASHPIDFPVGHIPPGQTVVCAQTLLQWERLVGHDLITRESWIQCIVTVLRTEGIIGTGVPGGTGC